MHTPKSAERTAKIELPILTQCSLSPLTLPYDFTILRG